MFKFDMRYVNVDQYGNVTPALRKATTKYDVEAFSENNGTIKDNETLGWYLLNLAAVAYENRDKVIQVGADGVTRLEGGKNVGWAIEK